MRRFLSHFFVFRPAILLWLAVAGSLAIIALTFFLAAKSIAGFSGRSVTSADPTLVPIRILPKQLDEVSSDSQADIAPHSWLSNPLHIPLDVKLSTSLCLHLLKLHGKDLSIIVVGEASPIKVVDLLSNDQFGKRFLGHSPLVMDRLLPAVRQSSSERAPDIRASAERVNDIETLTFGI